MSCKHYVYLVLLGASLLSVDVQAFDYPELDSIKSLDEFASPESFESAYKSLIQNCLDKSYGGSAGIPCLIETKIWDRELNTQYKKLYRTLDMEGQRLLKESQKGWLKMRAATYTAQSHIMDKVYPPQGTMYQLMRAGSIDELAAAMIRQRTLVLREWYRLSKSVKH